MITDPPARDDSHLRPIRSSEQIIIREERDTDTVTLHVSGVVDTITTPRLATRLEIALTSAPALLIVDLTDVEFLASAGIGLLVDVQHLTVPSATEMRVVAGPVGDRPLRILGVDDFLDLFPSVAAARAGVR